MAAERGGQIHQHLRREPRARAAARGGSVSAAARALHATLRLLSNEFVCTDLRCRPMNGFVSLPSSPVGWSASPAHQGTAGFPGAHDHRHGGCSPEIRSLLQRRGSARSRGGLPVAALATGFHPELGGRAILANFFNAYPLA